MPEKTSIPIIGYHGSNAEHPVFDVETGAFFSSSPRTSNKYGRNVTAHRIRMDNPAQWSTRVAEDFQDWLFDWSQDKTSAEDLAVFVKAQARCGVGPEDAEAEMQNYIKAVLCQPARALTFDDTDPVFGLLRRHLLEKGHDGFVRGHQMSGSLPPDGTLEYVPFHLSQFAPLLSPEAPRAVLETKLRDHGRPLVVYRGEQSGVRVDVFDRRATGERGFFFTPLREVAEAYASNDEVGAYVIAAERVLDLTRDTMENRKWVQKWGESFDDWTDRASGEETDAYSVLEGGRMFDYERTWSGERWKDLQATAELAGYDVVVLPDYDPDAGIFPAVVAFRPEQIWRLNSPEGEMGLNADRSLLRGGYRLPEPDLESSATKAPALVEMI